MSRVFGLISLGAILAGISIMPVAAAGPAAMGPGLRFVNQAGYEQTVAGSGWIANSRITFSLTQGAFIIGLELKTTSSGNFRVGVNNVDRCNGDLFMARDEFTHHARIQGPGLGCPVSSNPPTPILKVIKGAAVSVVVTHIDLPRKTRVKTVEGDAVYVWVAGTKQPAWIPEAPWPFFALMQRGTTPARACPEVECAAGFYWEWVAVKVGNSEITVNPACSPRCEIASYAIPVTIKKRPTPA